MRGFERGNDAFQTRAELEGVQRFPIRRRDIFCAPGFMEPRMLWSYARIVEPG